MCVYIYIYRYEYIDRYIYMHIYTHIYTYTYTHTQVCMHGVYMYVCIYIYIYFFFLFFSYFLRLHHFLVLLDQLDLERSERDPEANFIYWLALFIFIFIAFIVYIAAMSAWRVGIIQWLYEKNWTHIIFLTRSMGILWHSPWKYCVWPSVP